MISPTVKLDSDANRFFSTIVAKFIFSFSKRDLSGFRKLVSTAINTTSSMYFIDEITRKINRY